jgi:hypothetical protein
MGGIAAILNFLWPNDSANDAIKDAANTAAAAGTEQAKIAAAAIIRAAELSASGLIEAANIAAGEARDAREASYAFIKQATAQAQVYLDSTIGQTAPLIRKGQEEAMAILDKFGEKSANLYRPYIEAGADALTKYQELIDQGVTLSRGKMVNITTGKTVEPKSYDEWKNEQFQNGTYLRATGLNATGGTQVFNEQTGEYESTGGTAVSGTPEEEIQAGYQQYLAGIPSTTKTTTSEAPYNIEESPYYGLYQWQKDQQKKSINQALGTQGLSKSGYGIEKQVEADVGLDQTMATVEYQRAVDDYNRKLSGEAGLTGMGYEASGNLANIYNTLGANMADVSKWGAGSLANLQASIGSAKANAALGQGTSLSNVSQQSGTQLANIANQLGTNLAGVTMQAGQSESNIANQLGTTLANIYTNQGNQLAYLSTQNQKNQMDILSGLSKTGLSALSNWLKNRDTSNSYTYDWSGGGTYTGGNYGSNYGDWWAE